MAEKIYDVRVTPRAHRGVDEIFEYIYPDSPQNAEMVEDRLYNKMNSLDRLPNRFSRYLPLYSALRNFRSVAVWSFIIVYEVREEDAVVSIYDVFNGVQDEGKTFTPTDETG